MPRHLLALGLIAVAFTGCYARGAALFGAGAIVGVAVASHHHADVVYVESSPDPATTIVVVPAPPPSPPAPPPPQPKRFDAGATHASLRAADVSACRERGLPSGAKLHAKVTFVPSGRVKSVVIDQPSGLSQEAVQCLAEQLTVARAPAWEEGGEETVEESWAVK